jgi:hypothetical protein
VPFQDNNIAAGLPANSPFQVGRNNVDSDQTIENGLNFPWPADPAASYVYFDCAIGSMLDSGIVVHNRLPQVNRLPDTLAQLALDDTTLETFTGPGVNLKCQDQYADIVQRMGHARYWFRIWGQALRVGYQVPIPGIKLIGGVPAIPYDRNPQWAFNRIAPGGNYGGVILWHAVWSLWYTTAVPPTSQTIPAADPSAHINGQTPLPKDGIQAPYSAADDNAVPSAPTAQPPGFFVGGGQGGG